MDTILTEYLDKHIKLSKKDSLLLPIFHNCSQDQFFKYMDQWRIDAPLKHCNVFKGKNIVYTFYGASKFVSNDTYETASDGDLIYCIILNADFCKPVLQIFPFDTGAVSGKNRKIRPALVDWEKLNLGDRIERMNKFILMCYLNLDKYLDNDISYKDIAKTIIEAKLADPDYISHVGDMHSLMMDPNVADERRLCYEVHFDVSLKITQESIFGFVVPSKTLEKQKFKDILNAFRLSEKKVKFYPSSLKTRYEIGKFINMETKIITKTLLK